MDREIAGLYSLADEILVHICTYLPTVDVITFSHVCQRFHRVCSEKAVVRISNFQTCFQLTESLFTTYLKPKIVCDNIEVLNLNYCHWLPASTFSKISKLKKLKELHILDCRVSFAILAKILLNLRLRVLSWTWCTSRFAKTVCNTTHNLDSLRECLTELRHLVVHMSHFPRFFVEINEFVYACINLEGLEIYNLYLPLSEGFDHTSNYISLRFNESKRPSPIKRLKFLKCQDLNRVGTYVGVDSIRRFIDSFANAMAPWNVLWITQTGSKYLYEWWKKEQLFFNTLIAVDAVNLSGSWPVIQKPHRNYTARDFLEWDLIFHKNQSEVRNEGYEFSLKFLNHGGEVKCRELSFDDSGLTSELLCTIARQCPKVEHLSMARCLVYAYNNNVDHTGATVDIIEAFDRLCVNCSKITHLNLSKTEITIDYSSLANLKRKSDCGAFINIPDLTSLGISTWMLVTGVGQVYPKDYDKTWSAEVLRQCKDQREITEEQLKRTRMWELTEACPQLIKLTVADLRKPNTKKRYDFTVFDAEYACISRFTKLRHLSIRDPGYLCRGAFFGHIFRDCTNLATLRLKNVGISQNCLYIQQLTSSLVHAKSLENLSILQTRIHLPAIFYESLSKCSNLERFRLSLVDADPDSPNRIYSLATRLPKLNWLQVYMKSSITSCKELQARLARLVKERPCFTFIIENEAKKCRSYKETGPYIYLDGFSLR